MAESFSSNEWTQINNHLNGRLAQFGFPERRSRSLIFASWNIRKFGALTDGGGERKKSLGAMDMIIRFCSNCDLIAIQEVLEDFSSVSHLVDQLNSTGSFRYDYIVSDVTGQKPGDKSLAERFCFVYNTDVVKLGKVASDITFDRTAVLNNISAAYNTVFKTQFEAGDRAGVFDKLISFLTFSGSVAGKKLKRFVQFIRSPHIVEFVVSGDGGTDYQLYCVNAHLVSGKSKIERQNEFFALLEWLMIRSKKDVSENNKLIMLMADLNLDFESTVDRRRAGIEEYVTSLNTARNLTAKVNFPFLDPPHYTNARRSQTFDHIAFISEDNRWPRARNNDRRGTLGQNEFDYRMFDFIELFVEAGPGATTAGSVDFEKFEHDFTDHMPIWFRMPLPHDGQQTFPL